MILLKKIYIYQYREQYIHNEDKMRLSGSITKQYNKV
jgi:hypothetical protein